MKLLAVSGGVDSMVLFDKLKEDKIAVIHINHNTRGEENVKEENLVIKQCRKYNVPYYIFNYIHDGNGNFQKKAREFRYLKFKEVCEKKKYDSVLTAHHFDDQIENILMNPLKIGRKVINEESNINGVKVIRPLLNIQKQELYEYAKKKKIQFFEDSSNIDTKYLRNRIRIHLQNYTYEQKKEILTKEEKRYENILEKINFYKKKINLIDEVKTEEDVYALLKAQNIKSNISLTKIRLILSFLRKNSNGKITLDDTNKLITSYGKIYIINNCDFKKKINKKELIIGNNEFNNIYFYNSNLSGFIRTYKKNDKINIKNGTKKINRFFIDNKIPSHLRSSWPIIVDSEDNILKIIKMKDLMEEM